MAKLILTKAKSDVTVYLFIQDSSETTGAGLTGLAYDTADLVCYYIRPGGSATAITLATQTVTGAHSDGGFVEVDSTNMPGVYRLDLPDAVCATGVDSVVVMLKGAADMAPCILELQLDDYDLADIDTLLDTIDGKVDDIPSDVWDEILTGATHNVATSAGRRLRELGTTVIATNTAQGGGTNYITLDIGASATDEIYDENLVTIIGGTGIGQSRLITDYDGTSKRAYVNRNWEVTPDATSEFQIVGFSAPSITHHGLAQGGGNDTITLSTSASATDDIYNGQVVMISTSTGTGQVRIITDYNGTTKVATVNADWDVNPTSDSVYKILPTDLEDLLKLDTIQAKTDNLPADPAYQGEYVDQLSSMLAILGNPGDFKADVSALALEATLTAIKGAGWSDETLVALKAVVDAIQSGQLDAAGIRTAIGLASANLDTQLSTLASNVSTILADYARRTGDYATAQAVWEYVTRGLTEEVEATVDAQAVADAIEPLIPTADNIWTASVRTLTMTATEIISSISGSSITQVRGNSWEIEITDLTLNANKQQFAIKRSSKTPDDKAYLLIDSETGLLVVDGVEASDPTKASLSYVGTTLTITVDADITAELPARSCVYGIQSVSTEGAVSEPYGGTFVITGDVVRATA